MGILTIVDCLFCWQVPGVKKIKRTLKTVAAFTLVMVLLLVVSIAGTYAFLSHRLSGGFIPIVQAPANFAEVFILPVVEEIPARVIPVLEAAFVAPEIYANPNRLASPPMEAADELEEEYVPHEGYDYIYLRHELDTNVINILFIGDDARIHEREMGLRGRSDALMVASLNRENGHVFFTSIMRDTLVPLLDEADSWHRINHAYRAGGAGRSINVVNNALSLDIQHYVAVNFDDVFVLADRLGGLYIDLRLDEAFWLSSIFVDCEPLVEGLNLLNGPQVLAYSRMRAVDDMGDRGRLLRQQQVMRAVVSRVLNVDGFGDFVTLLNFSLNNLTTNMDVGLILSLAMDVFLNREDFRIHVMQVPVDDSFRGVLHLGSSVVQMDFEKNIRAVHEFIYGCSENVFIPRFVSYDDEPEGGFE